MSIIKKLSNRIAADGIFLGGFHLVSRIFRTVRSRIYGAILSAERLDIGGGCYIKGSKCIEFGKDISIFGNIWLEAVTHHNGHRYVPVISLGSGVSFSNNVHVSCVNRISVGDDVLIGSNVHISDHNHGRYGVVNASSPETPPATRNLWSDGPVDIGDRVWIGDNVVIIGPVHIGTGAIIGANSVVRSDIPASSIAVGVPARAVKMFNSVSGIWTKC